MIIVKPKKVNDILKLIRYEIKCQIIYSENVLKLFYQIKLCKNDLNSAKYLSFTVKPFIGTEFLSPIIIFVPH